MFDYQRLPGEANEVQHNADNNSRVHTDTSALAARTALRQPGRHGEPAAHDERAGRGHEGACRLARGNVSCLHFFSLLISCPPLYLDGLGLLWAREVVMKGVLCLPLRRGGRLYHTQRQLVVVSCCSMGNPPVLLLGVCFFECFDLSRMYSRSHC